MTEHIDPDCRTGKHRACPSWTWNDTTDNATPCECPCHDPQPPEDPR